MQHRSWLSVGIYRPITVLMLFITFLVTGIIAYSRIPLQMLPSGFSPPFLTVYVPYPNATPVDVERQLTRPIEEIVGTMPGVSEVSSVSRADGARVRIRFHGSVDIKEAYLQLQDRIERIRGDFPEDVENVDIRRFNADDLPIMYIGIYLNDSISFPNSEVKLKTLVQKTEILNRLMIPRIEQESGIAHVQLDGAYQQQVIALLSASLVQAHHVNIVKLSRDIRNSNLEMTAGEISQENTKYIVRSLGKLSQLQDLKQFPVTSSLSLDRIADVGYSNLLDQFRVRINGQPAVVAAIYKESTANTVEVCNNVSELMEELFQQPFFKDFSYSMLHNEGELVGEALYTLSETLLWGALFSVLVLYFFLRRINMTAIITLSIPFSLLIALMVVNFSGRTLNLLSLMGFTLGVGMLIDNAVVVVENIYSNIQKQHSLISAIVLGVQEVGLAVILATSTTLVVFLPMMLMGTAQEFKFFMVELGGAVCYSLIASLLAALVFIPPAIYFLEKNQNNTHHTLPKWSQYCENVIEKATGGYCKILKWVIENRLLTIVFILIPLVWLTMIISEKIGQTDKGDEARRSLSIRFKFADSHDITKNSDILLDIEEQLLQNKENLEIANVLCSCSGSRGQMHIWLIPSDKSKRPLPEIHKEINEMLPELPGVEIRSNWDKRGESAEEGDVPVVIRGEDSEILQEIAKDVAIVLREIPELDDVEIQEDEKQDEVVVFLNRELLQRYQISPSAAALTVSYALRGARISELYTKDKEIPIQLRFSTDGLNSIYELNNLKVFNAAEKEITLSNIATVSIQKGFGSIRRKNRKTSITVKAITQHEDLQEIGRKIDQKMKQIQLPRGYSTEKEGRFADMAESEEAFKFAMLLSVTFVFLLMGFLFESFILPLSIIISIPFAFLGVYWILYLTDTPIGVMVYLGLIILAGVVVNNGIVLVDHINRLRNQGLERSQAIIQGGKDRFRPILMTSLTTLFGLIPMAIGNSNFAGTPYYPLGRAVIGGMTMSTILTLLIIPIFYTLLDDFRNVMQSTFKKAFC